MMKYLEEKVGNNGAVVKYYLHEPNPEIDEQRLFPVMVICPGGGYMWTSYREDEMIALQFFAKGFHVVVVRYATEGVSAYQVPTNQLPTEPISKYPNPLVDLALAISMIKEHSKEWAINEEYIVVGGFSAGGNLAAQLGVHWHEDWLEQLVGKSKELYRPTHLMLAYAALKVVSLPIRNFEIEFNPMLYAMTGKLEHTEDELMQVNPINFVSEFTPPSFIWHTREDMTVPVNDSLEFAVELEKYQIPYELHIFDKGKHGLALANILTGRQTENTDAQVSKWVDLFMEWLAPIKTKHHRFFEYTE